MRLGAAIIAFAAIAMVAVPVAASAATQPVRQCKSYVQGRIDVLDAQLRKGEEPNAASKLLKRRDRLKVQLADCERNPNAYKKDI